MAKYTELTIEQRQAIDDGTERIREYAAELGKLTRKIKDDLSGYGFSVISQLVNSLDNGERVPKYDPSTKFKQGVSMSKETILLLVDLATKVAALATPQVRAACVDAAGTDNC